jgi:hypothetical protein
MGDYQPTSDHLRYCLPTSRSILYLLGHWLPLAFVPRLLLVPDHDTQFFSFVGSTVASF